jgi:outer membrane protein assembly factor BamE (lipoprotein component of BamABCDE complex)
MLGRPHLTDKFQNETFNSIQSELKMTWPAYDNLRENIKEGLMVSL